MTTYSIGEPIQGGYYSGRIVINSEPWALITAPKSGEIQTQWCPQLAAPVVACSYFDGLANTQALTKSNSIAEWITRQTINGFNDWYWPSQDELEMMYRAYKPSTTENCCNNRSGISLSSFEPSWPYIRNYPQQTTAPNFVGDQPEAFHRDYYWSSTQHQELPMAAWAQNFETGEQEEVDKAAYFWIRLVRRIKL